MIFRSILCTQRNSIFKGIYFCKKKIFFMKFIVKKIFSGPQYRGHSTIFTVFRSSGETIHFTRSNKLKFRWTIRINNNCRWLWERHIAVSLFINIPYWTGITSIYAFEKVCALKIEMPRRVLDIFTYSLHSNWTYINSLK